MSLQRKVVLVTRRTRLEALVRRFQTVDQARFYIEHLGANFDDYEAEHAAYLDARRLLTRSLEAYGRWQAIDREVLPSFLFGGDDVVCALGQDGLVANTMKYLDGQPILGVNPEPARFDGLLLGITPAGFARAVEEVLAGRRAARPVAMAEARLADGQSLLAVNDLFIGPRSHTSARYEIAVGDEREVQSSSGVIVSTGLGSTGWMTSIVTGAQRIAGSAPAYAPLPWDAGRLRFAVREPFPSRTTGCSIVYGEIDSGTAFSLTAQSENGIIFSDGIEADALAFGAGQTVRIGLAARRGRLVM